MKNDQLKDLKLVCVRLPSDLHLSYKKIALEKECSLQDLISKALKDYLNTTK